VRARLGVDALIGKPQPLDRASIDQMLLHNFRGILRLHVPIPDRFRINHYSWPVFALVQAAGLVDPHRAPKARTLGDLLQLRVQFALSIRRA